MMSVAAVGIAHADYAYDLVRSNPGLIDYVEIPFEQLLRNPSAIDIRSLVPVVLHCASLSMAGDVPPDDALVDALKRWVSETGTPWLGEHLAYVRADGQLRDSAAHEAFIDLSAPYNVGYTVNPQYSKPILERVAASAEDWSQRLGVPVLLENGPTYFNMPGSTMSQLEFIQTLCTRAHGVRLLLDLSHLAITCANLYLDPMQVLRQLPLERVIEVHVSGFHVEGGMCWDDHSARAPLQVFDLLMALRSRVQPRAVTIEYNWDASFPLDVVMEDVRHVRKIMEVATC
jgi:uncharacterized protein (UPF0276 family)